MPSISQQRIDDRSDKLLCGYIHTLEAVLNQTIPREIFQLCLVFYFLTEWFDDELLGEKLELNADKTIIRKRKPENTDWASALGIFIFEFNDYTDCILSWTLKLSRINIVEIGIISIDSEVDSKEILDDNCFWGEFNHRKSWEAAIAWYGIFKSASTYLDSHHAEARNTGAFKDTIDLEKNVSANVIRMEINVNNRTMELWINEKYCGIAFKDINIAHKYRFGLALGPGSSDPRIEIVKFEITKQQ